MCYGGGAIRTNIGSKSAISLQRGPVDPKFQVEAVAPTNHSSSQKTRLNVLAYGIKIRVRIVGGWELNPPVILSTPQLMLREVPPGGRT